MYLLTKSLVHLTPLKTLVISTKDGCPTLLANDGYFGQAYTLFYFYSCLFCKFKLIKGANKVVVVVVDVLNDPIRPIANIQILLTGLFTPLYMYM